MKYWTQSEDEWCNFIYGELDETSLYVMRRHYDLKKIYGDAPEVVKSCREYFEKQLGVVEDTLSQNGTLFGLEFGLDDILLTIFLQFGQLTLLLIFILCFQIPNILIIKIQIMYKSGIE